MHQPPGLRRIRLDVGVHPDSGRGLAGGGDHHQDELRPDGVRHRGLHRVRTRLRSDSLPHGGRDDAGGREVDSGGALHDGGDVLHLPPLQAEAGPHGVPSDTRPLRDVLL